MTHYLPQHKNFGEHQFALIDKAFARSLLDDYPSLDIVSAHLAPQSHLYPALISLHELPTPDWQKFITKITEQSQGLSTHNINLLLSSPLSAESLRNELASLLLINDEKQQNYLFRYYDPRVLIQLSWMLTPWQLQTYLKTQAIPSWTFFIDKQWHTLSFQEKAPYIKNDPINLPLEQINRIGLINQVLEQLPITKNLDEKIRLSRHIDELLLIASNCGLVINKDINIFVQQGIEQQCAFWLHHDVQAVLKVAAHNPEYYRRTTSNWNEKRWQEIKANAPTLITSKGI
jgi:hypothetical protein